MGYTHYWRRSNSMTPETFAAFSKDCKALCKASGVPLNGSSGDAGTKPEFKKNVVAFNGVEDDSHESFIVEPGAKDFDFCKTARKDYDLCVAACLIALKHHDHTAVVSSDGDSEEWEAARLLCVKTVGYGSDFSLSKD